MKNNFAKNTLKTDISVLEMACTSWVDRRLALVVKDAPKVIPDKVNDQEVIQPKNNC